MYEDLDKFLDNPSTLTILDIVEDYKELIKRALKGGTYFIDEESKTCCGLVRGKDVLLAFRLEQQGHHFTRGLRRKILEVCREWQAKTGLPIEVHTKACFYNEQVKKLLRLTHFETVAVKDGYYISLFRG
jgi:hypothetical protein